MTWREILALLEEKIKEEAEVKQRKPPWKEVQIARIGIIRKIMTQAEIIDKEMPRAAGSD